MLRVRDGWETSVRVRAAQTAARDHSLSPLQFCFMGIQLLARALGPLLRWEEFSAATTGASFLLFLRRAFVTVVLSAAATVAFLRGVQ